MVYTVRTLALPGWIGYIKIMISLWKRIALLGVLALGGVVHSAEYYKIDRGLFSSEFYMIRLDSDGAGQVNQYERMKAGAYLVRHQLLRCSSQDCAGGFFFLDLSPFQLHFGEGFLKQALGIPEKATKIEYFEALNRAGFIASTACIFDHFQAALSTRTLATLEISFPGLAHFPDFYERSTKVEFQAEILGLLKKELGRDFDHDPIEACIDRNFLLE